MTKKTNFGSTGPAFTTITSTGNVSIGNTNTEYQLRREIEQLTDIIHAQESEIRKLRNMQTQSGFTQAELKFLLMRCHPDKNPDSKMAIEITQKIIKKRRK
jgi:hypothetical protein